MSHASPSEDRFFAVPQTARPTSAGPVDLPILYFDATCVIALFLASRSGAEELLAQANAPGQELVPVLGHGDRVLAGMAFYDYRTTSVGPYHEVGLALFAQKRGDRKPLLSLGEVLLPPALRTVGMYVVDLPVTTPLADAAGRDLWGYPKFVTEIPFRREGRRLHTGVDDPAGSGRICLFEGELGPGIPVPPLQLLTLTRKDGRLLRTTVDVRGKTRLHAGGTMHLFVGSSRHPMAERLRLLQLDGKKPIAVLVTDPFRARLPEGRPAE